MTQHTHPEWKYSIQACVMIKEKQFLEKGYPKWLIEEAKRKVNLFKIEDLLTYKKKETTKPESQKEIMENSKCKIIEEPI